MTLSVIIATMDRATYVDRNLSSLSRSRVLPDEVLVVDSSHTGDTRDAVEAWTARWPVVQYVAAPNTGVSRARNLGVQASTGELVMITDDDCVTHEDCIGHIIRAFAEDPAIDCITGAVHPYGEPHGQVAVAIKNSPERREWVGKSRPWDLGISVNASFRREQYQRVGGFDEEMGPGATLIAAEDLDLLYRVLKAGGKIVYEPAAIVYHDQWRSRAQARRRRADYGQGIAAFLVKHGLAHRDGYVLRLVPLRLWEDVPHLALVGLMKRNLELELVSMYQLWGWIVGAWIAGRHYGRHRRSGGAPMPAPASA